MHMNIINILIALYEHKLLSCIGEYLLYVYNHYIYMKQLLQFDMYI
jgi:hypothetical protein